MNYLNGGYAMIKYNASQKDLAAAYKSNRPVLVYDENQKAHWAQINETVTTETIDDEIVTTYTYSYELINNITSLVDSAGNPRFIEGDGTAGEITGFTSTYCKWSLSGTHLMLVLAGTFANGAAVASSSTLATFKVPDFIRNKVFTVWSNNIEAKTISTYASDWSAQNFQIKFQKTSSSLKFEGSSITFTAERSFRVQFDLLIDSDYSE